MMVSLSKPNTFRLGRLLILILMLACPFFVWQSWRNQQESLAKDAKLRAAFRQEWQNLLAEVLWRRFVTDRGQRPAKLYRALPDQPLQGLPPFMSREAFVEKLGVAPGATGLLPEDMRRLLWSDQRFPSGMPQAYAGMVELLRGPLQGVGERDINRLYAVARRFATGEGVSRPFFTLLLERLPKPWREVFVLQRRFCALESAAEPDVFLVSFQHNGGDYLDAYSAAEVDQINRALSALNLDLALSLAPRWARYDDLWLTLAPRRLPAHEQLRRAQTVHLLMVLFVEIILLVIYLLIDQYDKIHRFQQQLLAATSHELRTPLAVIRQFAELLQKKRDQFPARVQTYHQFVLRESMKMQFMVENLLRTARFEHLHLRPKPSSFALGPWLTECIDVAQQLDAAWTVAVGDLPECTVFWDAGMMEQVVMNLLDNARVHAKTDVTVQVSLTDNGRVRLAVRDRGAEVDVVAMRRIQAFKRSDHPDTGLGLGLYLCATIVKGHQGTLQFEEADPGLRVTIDLPQRIKER
ncbi:sensor histidine kinase [Acanthopleuribacter pedis]|uniref:histidine kinase n=1 Tax=Acanthopleuribacter pedis TaxID=442870 RepID=A0A8J7Q6Y0_9BACT|nr:HAMP domain-containing sensor histidine kinase [Acanthopleuribacter pedis]MBO1321697.1 HAMP domain-containing histidine kinase [Acanthopleuribacter pedis]